MNKMKSFILIATQSGGCDYTIGCGVDYWYEHADSMEDLKNQVRKSLLSEDQDVYLEEYKLNPNRLNIGNYFEQLYDSLTIIEVGESYNVPLEELAKEYKESMNKIKVKDEDEAERKEYEKLRAKFDPKFKPKSKPKIFKFCDTCGDEFSTKAKYTTACKSCKKKAKVELELKNIERVRVNKVREGLVDILAFIGWKANPQSYSLEVQGGKLKVNRYGFEFYDKLIMKGSKKTFSWRDIGTDEVLELKLLPEEAEDYIQNNRDVFLCQK
jgi:hypothetical protein